MAAVDLTALYTRHRADVVRYLRSRGASAELAEDLTQAVFLRAGTAVGYRDQGKPLAWLFTIASRLLADQRKSAHARRCVATEITDWSHAIPYLTPIPDPVEDMVLRRVWRQQAAVALSAALATLKPSHRRVVQLRLLEGRSPAATAAAVGMTPGSVRVTQHRALQALADDPRIQALQRQWEH